MLNKELFKDKVSILKEREENLSASYMDTTYRIKELEQNNVVKEYLILKDALKKTNKSINSFNKALIPNLIDIYHECYINDNQDNHFFFFGIYDNQNNEVYTEGTNTYHKYKRLEDNGFILIPSLNHEEFENNNIVYYPNKDRENEFINLKISLINKELKEIESNIVMK